MAYIEVNGSRSDQLGLRLLRGFERKNAENDVTEISVLGRDGVLLIDNERKKPIERTFDFTVRDEEELINSEMSINEWLNFTEFKDAIFSWDSRYIYRIRPYRQYDLDEVALNFGELEIEFQIHPVKFQKDGQREITFSDNTTLQNDFDVSYPKIELSGTGEMSIVINGRKSDFKDVQGGLIIDSFERLVHYKGMQRWKSFVRTPDSDFPYLDKGLNQITVTGGTATLVPNWQVKL